MIRKLNTLFDGLHTFIILWATQGFSALGSSMTSYALVIWAYQQEGSALASSLLTVCSYAPYVLLSIFAGALSDRWNKKLTMLVCDSFAALCTLSVLVLLVTGRLELWHLYVLNALNGLGNTLQQPASDVAVSLLTPREHIRKQRDAGLFQLPCDHTVTVFATALLSAFGIYTVIAFDLLTFTAAFLSLAFFVKLPEQDLSKRNTEQASVLQTAGQGLRYLRENRASWILSSFWPASIWWLLCTTPPSRHAALQRRRKPGCTGTGVHLYGPGKCNRQCHRHLPASPKEPGQSHLPLPPLFHEHGKLSAGSWPGHSCMVSGSHPWLAIYPGHEHQHGRPLPHPHSCGDAGAGLLRKKYSAVFHHTRGLSAGRRSRRPGL